MTGFIFLAMAMWLPEKRPARSPPFDFFCWATFSLGLTGLQMLLDRGERLEWFALAEIWAETLASVLGFCLFIVHVLTAETDFLNKALFKGGFRRGHRPVQDSDDRHAGREPACPGSVQTAPGQLMLAETKCAGIAIEPGRRSSLFFTQQPTPPSIHLGDDPGGNGLVEFAIVSARSAI